MKKFPGVLVRSGKGHRITLSDEQVAWLRQCYPTTENTRIAKRMGVGLSKIHDLARDYGLQKSEKGLLAIRRRRDKAAARTNERNGCYARKRGHRPSEATIEGCRRRWREERDGLRENAQLRIKREEPEKYRRWMAKRSTERKESIRKEKLRVFYGLERKTRIVSVVMQPYTKSQLHHRYNALKRGYLLDEDCSEGTSGRYRIYYDDDTQRSERFEANCIKDGFEIVRDE